MHKHQPSISSTRTNDEGLDGAVPPASVFLFVAHPIIASTTATPTPPTHSLTLSLTLTVSHPHLHPHQHHTHTSRLHCLFSSPSPSLSMSCDVVGDSHRRSFYGPGRPPNHLSYTHLLSPQPSGTAHHLSPSDVTPVLHLATYYCYYYYYDHHHNHHHHHQHQHYYYPELPNPHSSRRGRTSATTALLSLLLLSLLVLLLRAIHVALPIVSYHDCTDR